MKRDLYAKFVFQMWVFYAALVSEPNCSEIPRCFLVQDGCNPVCAHPGTLQKGAIHAKGGVNDSAAGVNDIPQDRRRFRPERRCFFRNRMSGFWYRTRVFARSSGSMRVDAGGVFTSTVVVFCPTIPSYPCPPFFHISRIIGGNKKYKKVYF